MTRPTRRQLFRQLGAMGLIAGTLRDQIARADAGSSGIKRVVFFYLSSGVHGPAWRPSTPSASDVSIDAPVYGQVDKQTNTRRHILDVFDQPRYAGLKQDLMLVDGIDMRAIARPDVHVNGIWAGLRGRPSRTADPKEKGKFATYSVDRLIGEAFDRQGRGDSFLVSSCTNVLVSELGQQASVGSHSEGYNARVVRSSAEAWDLFLGDLGTGTGPDTSREVARLEGELDRWELSEAGAQRMKALVPVDSRAKLEQLLETYRAKQSEIRRTIQRLRQPVPAGLKIPPLPSRAATDPDPSLFMKEKSDLLAKVMSIALGLGRTQVAVWQTFGSNNDRGLWYFGGKKPNFHNDIAHGGAYKGIVAPATWEVYAIEMQMLGNLLLELKAIPEGSGTALDSTLVVTYADMSDGGHHYTIPCFTLVAGGRNGRLGGKALKLGKYVKLPAQRSNGDFLMTMAHLAGVTDGLGPTGQVLPLDSFGASAHSTGLVREIFG